MARCGGLRRAATLWKRHARYVIVPPIVLFTFSLLTASPASAIYGGTKVNPGPSWIASVSSAIGSCSASLISQDWVLTAGHCVGGLKADRGGQLLPLEDADSHSAPDNGSPLGATAFRVTVGRATTSRSGEGPAENLNQVLLAPNFSATAILKTTKAGKVVTRPCGASTCGIVRSISIIDDFALLHLDSPLPGNTPVTLSTGDYPAEGADVAFFGYGHRASGPDNLKTVPVGTYSVNNAACGYSLYLVCFKDASFPTITVQTGDSGGPWFPRVNQCGPGPAPEIAVESLGGDNGFSIASNIAADFNWISSIVNDLPIADYQSCGPSD